MAGIIVYNRTKEDYSSSPNNYPIYRGGSILGNPYTSIKDRKTKAMHVVNSKEEAIKRYASYFDMMYSGNLDFQTLVDEIYEKYKSGETIFLECYCAPNPCHGDIIKKKLEQRRIKEILKEKSQCH